MFYFFAFPEMKRQRPVLLDELRKKRKPLTEEEKLWESLKNIHWTIHWRKFSVSKNMTLHQNACNMKMYPHHWFDIKSLNIMGFNVRKAIEETYKDQGGIKRTAWVRSLDDPFCFFGMRPEDLSGSAWGSAFRYTMVRLALSPKKDKESLEERMERRVILDLIDKMFWYLGSNVLETLQGE